MRPHSESRRRDNCRSCSGWGLGLIIVVVVVVIILVRVVLGVFARFLFRWLVVRLWWPGPSYKASSNNSVPSTQKVHHAFVEFSIMSLVFVAIVVAALQCVRPLSSVLCFTIELRWIPSLGHSKALRPESVLAEFCVMTPRISYAEVLQTHLATVRCLLSLRTTNSWRFTEVGGRLRHPVVLPGWKF